jgi:molecular chaperone DnaK (HSP70)
MLRVQNIPLGQEPGVPFASAVAVERQTGKLLFGQDALRSRPTDWDLLLNWKLLLGKNAALLNKERAENDSLSRIIDRHSLDEIACRYFAHIFDQITKNTKAAEKPQIIVGIPGVAEGTRGDWRNRYRDTIERAFRRLELPTPRFFPEPFAVFQYHWNKSDITDVGRHHNILILDIGGGTTNVCFIQTTQHGRLARGGANHVPHGVKSIEVGGSTIDRLISERLMPGRMRTDAGFTALSISHAKERLSERANNSNAWQDKLALGRLAEIIETTAGRRYTLTGGDLTEMVVNKFWPMVSEIVRDSISEVRAIRLANPVEKLDFVILAGGTCQIDLIEMLFRQSFFADAFFSGARFIRSPDYECAVAEGLAIEASANCRLHDIRPTRVAPYLQDDICFLASHRVDSLEVPRKLRPRTESLSSRIREGIIIEAPQGISDLIGRKLRWSFTLAQRPRELFFRLFKARDAYELEHELISLSS